MDAHEAEALVTELYDALLKRKPAEKELGGWASALLAGMSFENMFRAFKNSDEFKSATMVRTKFPPGHYHSPIVDPSLVEKHLQGANLMTHLDIEGIEIDPAAMRALWMSQREFISATPFQERKTPGKRYFFGSGPYPIGDASVMRMMMGAHRPKRVFEIGSGFSSACVLDCADELAIPGFQLICMEPYPERLKSLLEPTDNITIIDSEVQSVPGAYFEELERDDILIIDSTHVMKTGSDVCHELFNILPRLRPGVLVHVHDCQFPFEYPRQWVVDDNFSWNEIYGLRAFLMYNERFKVYFWSSLFARIERELIASTFQGFLLNPGSAIWLSVT